MHYALALLFCFACAAQTVAHRYPAGAAPDGATLTVLHKRFPPHSPDAKRCLPADQYLLQLSAAGRVISTDPVVTLCATDDQADVKVSVSPNTITVDRNGGSQAGYFLVQSFQLLPWRTLSVNFCSFYGSGEFTYEEWDYRTLRARAWHSPAGSSGEICGKSPGYFSYFILPTVPVDAALLQSRRARLSSCALTLDASGRNGFLIYGKPDPRDPVQVKLLLTSADTLLVQIIDPNRTRRPAASWINSDHIEIWMGAQGELADRETTWQFGIPLHDAPVQIGFGTPPKLPTVARWQSTLPGARTATLLKVQLPPRPNTYSTGLTVVYSQSEDARRQKRLIATSPFKRADLSTLGSQSSAGRDSASANHVTCGLIDGALEITGGPPKPVQVPPPGR